MMPRVAAIIALSATICLAAPKERAWQDGRLLDMRDNPYFTGKDFGSGTTSLMPAQSYNNDYMVSQNSGTSKVVYDHYVIESRTTAYLVEQGRLKDYPGAHVTVRRALKFAVEKNKLWMIDEDGKEVETKVLKQVERPGTQMVTKVETPAPAAPVAAAAPGLSQPDRSLRLRPWPRAAASPAPVPVAPTPVPAVAPSSGGR